MNLYDKTCTIKRTTYSNVGGVARKAYTTTYSNIRCSFYYGSSTLSQADRANNVERPAYEVVLPKQYTNVKKDDIIELFDSRLGSVGEYIVYKVTSYDSMVGSLSNIVLHTRAIKGK